MEDLIELKEVDKVDETGSNDPILKDFNAEQQLSSDKEKVLMLLDQVLDTAKQFNTKIKKELPVDQVTDTLNVTWDKYSGVYTNPDGEEFSVLSENYVGGPIPGMQKDWPGSLTIISGRTRIVIDFNENKDASPYSGVILDEKDMLPSWVKRAYDGTINVAVENNMNPISKAQEFFKKLEFATLKQIDEPSQNNTDTPPTA